jgi:hypothetical protein
MSEIINLRQHRKAKARSEKEKTAEQNRTLHGRTKAQKKKEEQDAERLEKHLDGHKLEDGEDE